MASEAEVCTIFISFIFEARLSTEVFKSAQNPLMSRDKILLFEQNSRKFAVKSMYGNVKVGKDITNLSCRQYFQLLKENISKDFQ